MSHDTIQGAIRPESAPSTASTEPGRDFRRAREGTAARRAAEHLADREGLVICSFDASAREAI